MNSNTDFILHVDISLDHINFLETDLLRTFTDLTNHEAFDNDSEIITFWTKLIIRYTPVKTECINGPKIDTCTRILLKTKMECRSL